MNDGVSFKGKQVVHIVVVVSVMVNMAYMACGISGSLDYLDERPLAELEPPYRICLNCQRVRDKKSRNENGG